ncbi:MAG: FmdB family zinc ribbon protein [Pseudomonadota bacterium]
MPIHEYRCSQCGQVNELIVGIGRNSDELVCRSCGGSKLEELMSASAISVNNGSPEPAGSTCCGSNPSSKGCVPGSCCGAA